MKIRIGTRTSLMAMAQARIVARLLKENYPGIETEYVGIVPSGDKDKTTPLPQMNAIGIFSKEIDDRLLAGEIDCAVHSLKDLGTQRPAGIARAAILPRDDVHDIILFHPDIIARLQQGKTLRVGTSAPRRGELLPPFLKKALPSFGRTPQIELVSIRGNANTRIAKLRDNAQNLDAIVLALAGLGRLYGDDESRAEIIRLMDGLKRMIVPVTVCPPAPGQGTVCIETLNTRPDISDLFKPINHASSEKAINAEYEILTGNGGGCHQRFGVLSVKLPAIKDNILLIRGKNKDGIDISETRWDAPPRPHGNIWNGHDYSGDLFTTENIPSPLCGSSGVFIAHHRALPDNFQNEKNIWVSGVQSWYALAAKNYWVEGCADSFGFDYIAPTLTQPVLNLPPLSSWDILSHKDAQATWKTGNFVATYSHHPKNISPELIKSLQNADIFWWASASQYEALKSYLLDRPLVHFCGPGKTAEILAAQGVKPLYVCPDSQTFYRWIHDESPGQSASHFAEHY